MISRVQTLPPKTAHTEHGQRTLKHRNTSPYMPWDNFPPELEIKLWTYCLEGNDVTIEPRVRRMEMSKTKSKVVAFVGLNTK